MWGFNDESDPDPYDYDMHQLDAWQFTSPDSQLLAPNAKRQRRRRAGSREGDELRGHLEVDEASSQMVSASVFDERESSSSGMEEVLSHQSFLFDQPLQLPESFFDDVPAPADWSNVAHPPSQGSFQMELLPRSMPTNKVPIALVNKEDFGLSQPSKQKVHKDKRRKHKVLTASDNVYLIEHVPSYIDEGSGTVSWGTLMDEHPQFAAGHTARQLSERWKLLRGELPNITELRDKQKREDATRRVVGWLVK